MNTELFINGKFVPAQKGGTIDVLNPANGELITKIAAAEAEDVDIAVAAAKKAFPAWAATPAAERGRLLLKLADLIEEHAEELAQIESLDTGHPIRDSRRLDVPRTAACFRYFGGMADKIQGSVIPVEQGFLNYVVREPVGVVGQIVPWNFPLMFTSWKLGPALAAGNTVVMKPSELTPLSTLKIAELIQKAGFPDGVVNIVAGYGNTAGQRIADHEDIAKVAFTGSTQTGQSIVRASAGNLKRLQLELGGKGANIVFEDADIDAAVNGSAWAIFHNQGQACIAGSRLMLHESIADEFLEKFVKLAESIRLGDPLNPETEMGPLTSESHRNKVLSYAEIATEQGGKILTGGKAPEDAALKNGYYVLPTVVEAKPTDRVAQEEVFGPFVTVLRFKNDEEALEIANGTEYGLGSGLWTKNLQRAHLFARKIRAGMCWINSYKRVNPGSPFGGVGKSGYGREMGFEAIHDYTEAKSVWVNVDAQIPPHFDRRK
ncbi:MULTISPECIES: aldehyde dehydrogenase family protein [Neisseria]|uniref:Aldehyde dehydrogenase A n=1 Tax=Neisseria canis TaxID=493 RepID=A0A1X3CUQ1_9NEIS|nr:MULTISPECIES: aldehyde dehydrogenase family protein [Neisseria]OSI11350.1 betaine-aldehyde dehydrogenase [Neisseria canis]OSI14579.1 betaine-aldehyde dehydrogenase [Neisseria dumasiana]VEF00266.1 aldehyde dehydrogenase A [Neisseria canis]